MKRVTIIKTILENLIAASVCALVVATSFALPYVNAASAPGSAAGPVEWSAPAEGAGRVTCMNEEKMHENDFLQVTGKSESSTEILAAQEETETEKESDAVFESYEQVTVNEDAEEYVEVIPEREDPPACEIDVLIREAAERYGLPWELVSAVCWAESTYNPYAVSSTPDYGLMQVTQSVMGSYGLTADNWMDPAANLDAGCRILREKIDESGGDLTIALMKYNEGDAQALANMGAGIWSTSYTDSVLGKYYEILREGKR